MKMKIKVASTRLRNPFHDHPLLKKGGVHEKSDKSKRRIEKQKLKNGEWYEQSVYQNILFIPFIKGQVA